MHMHPAQMAHPRSISNLSALCREIPAPLGSERRIYVSRADASRRRAGKRGSLVRALEGRGFHLSRIEPLARWRANWTFSRSGNRVIGPHGMGLTHIIMGERIGRLLLKLVLQPPVAGTDAYAFVARVGGIHYDFVTGTECIASPDDFEIDPDRVLDILGPEELPIKRSSWSKAANLIPASRSFWGFFPPVSDVDSGVNQLIWGEGARVHQGADGAK